MPPSPPSSHAYPQQPADASSYQSSSKTKRSSSSGTSSGAKVAKAVGQGMFALVAMPVVVTAGALYGSGKLVEGIGRGLSAGPGAVLKAYRKIDEKIKGDKDKDAGAGAAEREREEERWHRYQQQQQYQEQQRYQYQHEQQYGYERGEGGRGMGGAMGEEGLKPKPKLE